MHSKLRTKNGWRGKGRTGVLGGNFTLGRFFRGGKVGPGFFFPRGKIYTGIRFPGAILSRGGFSGGEFYAGGNSMLQHRSPVARPYVTISTWGTTKELECFVQLSQRMKLSYRAKNIFRQGTIFRRLFLISSYFFIFHRNKFCSFMPMEFR